MEQEPAEMGVDSSDLKSTDLKSREVKRREHAFAPSQANRATKDEWYEIADTDRVQTGPGVPAWQWNKVFVHATGTVKPQQTLSIIYSSPPVTTVWRILNVLLVAGYSLILGQCFLRAAKKEDNSPQEEAGQGSNGTGAVVGAFLFLLSGLATPNHSYATPPLPDVADYPPKYLLDEYEARLFRAPACLPECVSLNRGRVVIRDQQLQLSFDVHAEGSVALPLPAAGNTWVPDRITQNRVKPALRREGDTLYLKVDKGIHRISMAGKILNNQFSIGFPVPIHNVTVEAENWGVEGLSEGAAHNNTLSFYAKEVVERGRDKTLTPTPIKPFAQVNRMLILGKQWRLITSAQKIAPASDSASFNIQLLPNEKILSSAVVARDGVVNLQFSPGQQRVSWESTIPQDSMIKLVAHRSSAYSETWSVKASSIWSVKATGIPQTKSQSGAALVQTWQPWPGEGVELAIHRPRGVEGKVYTTDHVSLIHKAGTQTQKTTLKLSVRASQAGRYRVDIPSNAQLDALTHNGKRLNLPDGKDIEVQLHPGPQHVELEFEQPVEMTWLSKTPLLSIPGEASNIALSYQLPRDRWLIYLDGPELGAAMVYWGVLIVVIAIALMLPTIANRLDLAVPVSILGWLLIGLGLSTVNTYGALVLIAFFFGVAALDKHHAVLTASKRWRQLILILVFILTLVAAWVVVATIPSGLLSTPNMTVVGNGSSGHLFKYYQDVTVNEQVPIVEVYSLPMWIYRVVMLAWSLWMAQRLLVWAKWWFGVVRRYW